MIFLSKLKNKFHTFCKKSKDKTIPDKPYHDGFYKTTWHCVNRMKERNITKGQLHVNLHTTPLKKTKTKKDKLGRPSYKRFSNNKICSKINPYTKRIPTVHEYETKDLLKYIREMGKKYGKIF